MHRGKRMWDTQGGPPCHWRARDAATAQGPLGLREEMIPPWSLQSPLTPISGLWLPELWDLLCEATQFLVLCDSIPTQLISHPEALWPKQGSKLHVGNNWSQEKMRGTRWPTQAASASEAVCTHSSRLSVAVGVGCLSICSPDRKGCWSHSLPSSAWLSWDPHSQELGTHS